MDQKSVKVLFAITKSNWGGAGRYVYDLARHFANDPMFSVSVLVGGNGELITKLHEYGIRVTTIPHLKRDIGFMSDLKSSLFLFKTIIKERPDILHVNSSKMGLFGSILGRIAGVSNIVFTAHGWPFNEIRPRYQRIIFRVLAMLTVITAHRTIAVSQAVITSLRAPRFITNKMSLVYTGIEPPILLPRGDFFNHKNSTQTPAPNIISIGELHLTKGYDRALIALAKCKHLPWTYHIVGEGEKREYLEKLITQLDLRGRVVLHGFIENASLYLNSFDLFLFPSRTEALGYVAIEALFSNIPIIASNVGGIPEVLFDDPYSKIIDCDNEKVFKETLLSFLQKPPTVDGSKRPGRTRFLTKFMYAATKKLFLTPVR
jgi:glycosyltransferase involved in cell wall biosynthesis